jgi:predicted ArsR family transcriptional regulator
VVAAHTHEPSEPPSAHETVAAADVALDRDVFLRSLLRRLTGTLEDLVGLDETSGFVSVVGDEIGHLIDDEYKRALGTDQLDATQVGAVLVDLKRRIEGDFRVTHQDDERIEFGNRACPFGDQVLGRPSLCMMTSNVFGSITAENLGYARVELLRTIAEGDPGCHVVVHLQPTTEATTGREYFGGVGASLDAAATEP